MSGVDYPKKYWWVVLVLVPLLAAVVTILKPPFASDDEKPKVTATGNNAVIISNEGEGSVTHNPTTVLGGTVNNISGGVVNSGIVNNYIPDPESKRLEIARADHQQILTDRKNAYKEFTKEFISQEEVLFHGNSLVETLRAFSNKERALLEVELVGPPAVYEQAQRLYSVARKSISCTWHEMNMPKDCLLPRGSGGGHPKDQYTQLYSSMKREMAKAVKSK